MYIEHLFTKKELHDLIAQSKDDMQYEDSRIVVDNQGYLQIVHCRNVAMIAQAYPVFSTSFTAGGHLGPKAANDANWVEDLYCMLRDSLLNHFILGWDKQNYTADHYIWDASDQDIVAAIKQYIAGRTPNPLPELQ